jgi:hypothetical protein
VDIIAFFNMALLVPPPILKPTAHDSRFYSVPTIAIGRLFVMTDGVEVDAGVGRSNKISAPLDLIESSRRRNLVD